jgi:transcriptional regulator with PAS, ATPase and Fis domain
MEYDWVKEFAGAVTVCDKDGIILYMNDKAIKAFADKGGDMLIGSNVTDCHPEPAKSKLQKMLDTGTPNCYTIEKKGVKKLIYQTPWYQEGEYMGFIELSLEIPFTMPHFLRK